MNDVPDAGSDPNQHRTPKMLSKTKRLAMAMAMLWFVFGAGDRAEADLTLTTPPGLTAGDTFRIVFVTDGQRHRPRAISLTTTHS